MPGLFCLACSTPEHPVEAELPGRVCFRCGNLILAALHWIEECLPILDARKGSPTTSRRAPGFGATSPARDAVVVARDPRSKWDPDDIGVMGLIGAWGRHVSITRRIPQPERASITGDVAYLRVNHNWITQQDWVDEYLRELVDAAHAVRRLAGFAPDGPVGRCMSILDSGEDCNGKVYPTKTRDGVRCAVCGREYTGYDLIRLRVAQREAS